MDTERPAGWLKASLDRLRQTPAEMAVRHIIAQSSKQFFGYGPKGRSEAVVQGDRVVFRTELTGPLLLDALQGSPFGRLVMRQIGELYRLHVREELAQLATAHFGVGLLAVMHDLDFDGGYSIGIALLDRPVGTADTAAAPPRREALLSGLAAARAALGAPDAAGAIWGQPSPPVREGPALISVRTEALRLPPAAEEEQAVFARLAAWTRARDAFAAALWAAWRDGEPAGATAFLAQDEQHLVGGVMFDGGAPVGLG